MFLSCLPIRKYAGFSKETDMEKKTEQKVADTMLQRPVVATIGGRDYDIAPPTIGTLVIASEYLCAIPAFNPEQGNYFFEVLAKAKDCKPMAYALAALVLGSKHWNDEDDTPRPWWVFLGRKKARRLKRDILVDTFLNEVSPREIGSLLVNILQTLEVADFFANSVFLGGVHMTKPTKTETKVIRRGPSSPDSSSPSA